MSKFLDALEQQKFNQHDINCLNRDMSSNDIDQ
jgi:hypothetical protein